MASEEFRSSPDVRTGFVKGNTFSYRQVQYSVIDGQAIFEGDIVLDTVEGMEQLAADVIARAVIIPGAQFRWPEGSVPFTIDPALPNVARVNDAISHWHTRTNIRLVAHTTEQNFVTFRPGNGCSSSVGMRGGQQFITLAPGCDRGAVIHEIGHAVGLWHEQSREDRDQFIRIHFENIDPGREHNFNQHITDGDDIGPYDFGSIMHYDAFAFSRNGLPTIETLHGEAIGQRNGLSDGDIQAVNFMYPRVHPTDDHIHELWWDGSGWHYIDLSAAVGGAPNAIGSPAGYTFDGQGTQHVVYRGTDNHIHDLWWDASGWHYIDLSAAVGGAPNAAGSPAGYTFDGQGTQHVAYRGTEDHIHDLWWDASGWHYIDLSAAVGGAPNAAGSPAGYTFDGQGTQHVAYRGKALSEG